jgi:hypothetical protein
MVLIWAVVRDLLLDLAPLRGREFRLLFLGQLVSFFGSMITFVALPFQMYSAAGRGRCTATVALSAIGWGVAIVAFGLADALWLALACLGVAGAMDAISGLFRSVIWNETIPDRLRGGLAGVEMISYTSGPTLGDSRRAASPR